MKIFETVLEMSLSASAAIAAVLVLRLVLGRMPKGFTWVLWLAVLARLWVPAFPEVSLPVRVPEMEPAAVLEQVFPPQSATEPVAPPEPEQSVPEVPADSPKTELLPVLWAVGACSVAAWGLLSDIRLRKRLRTAVRREDGVWLADGIESPFVHGLIFPKIYLPSSWDGAQERYILLHERRHIRSLDPVVKVLFFGALCIHWFNPLVWLACYYAERDMELRCDEGVFRSLNREERTEYAATLVACSGGRRTLMPLAFGEGDTKRRVKNMLTYRKPKWWAIILAAVLCITAAGCMLVEPVVKYDADLLEYPGLRWGMTFEETQAALGFSDGDILESAHGELHPEQPVAAAYHEYGVANVEIFGFPAKLVILRFHEYYGHEPGLAQMEVYFPDGYDGSAATDMDALRKTLTEHYGEKAESVTKVSWNAISGGVDVTEYPYPGDDPSYWVSKITARDLLTQEELERLHVISNESRGEAMPDRKLPDFEEFCQTQENHAVTMNLRTHAEGKYLDWVREQGGTGLVLNFDAQLVVHTLAIDRYFK